MAICLQGLYLVDPSSFLLLKLDFKDLAGMFAFQPLQDRRQWQDLPGLQRGAGALMVVPATGRCRLRGQAASQASQ